jgi:hypothetical protein
MLLRLMLVQVVADATLAKAISAKGAQSLTTIESFIDLSFRSPQKLQTDGIQLICSYSKLP